MDVSMSVTLSHHMQIVYVFGHTHYDEGVCTLHQILQWSQTNGLRTASLERRPQGRGLTLLLEVSPKFYQLLPSLDLACPLQPQLKGSRNSDNMADSGERLPRCSCMPSQLCGCMTLSKSLGYLTHLQLSFLMSKMGVIIIVSTSSGLGAHSTPPHLSSSVTSNTTFLLTSRSSHELLLLPGKYFAPILSLDHYCTADPMVSA